MTTTLATTFTEFNLHPGVEAAVAAMGITNPTPIQEQVIPAMMEGRDIIGQARTGSGKTLAYAIPIAEMCDPTVQLTQAIVLVPTRELAIQVASVVRPLAETRRLRTILLYGGRALEPERRALVSRPQIIIGTPGRVQDHLRQRTLSLRNLRIFVLDEGDEMLDRGFGPSVEQILSLTPRERQTALLSATVPQWVISTAARHLQNPVTLQVDSGLQAPPEIEHTVYEIDPNAKFDALRELLDKQGMDPILVFGKTKHGVRKLADKLIRMGYSVDALQGNLSQSARERVLGDFRSGRISILVATNVAARGLDIIDICQVINYELPETAELFTHRTGRTGRMGRSGEAITFITPEDASRWRQMERELDKPMTRKRWGHPDEILPNPPRWAKAELDPERQLVASRPSGKSSTAYRSHNRYTRYR